MTSHKASAPSSMPSSWPALQQLRQGQGTYYSAQRALCYAVPACTRLVSTAQPPPPSPVIWRTKHCQAQEPTHNNVIIANRCDHPRWITTDSVKPERESARLNFPRTYTQVRRYAFRRETTDTRLLNQQDTVLYVTMHKIAWLPVRYHYNSTTARVNLVETFHHSIATMNEFRTDRLNGELYRRTKAHVGQVLWPLTLTSHCGVVPMHSTHRPRPNLLMRTFYTYTLLVIMLSLDKTRGKDSTHEKQDCLLI